MKYIVIIIFVLSSYFILAQLPKEYSSCLNEWRKYKYVPIDTIKLIQKDSIYFYFDLKRVDSLDIMSKYFKGKNIKSMQLVIRKPYSIY